MLPQVSDIARGDDTHDFFLITMYGWMKKLNVNRKLVDLLVSYFSSTEQKVIFQFVEHGSF